MHSPPLSFHVARRNPVAAFVIRGGTPKSSRRLCHSGWDAGIQSPPLSFRLGCRNPVAAFVIPARMPESSRHGWQCSKSQRLATYGLLLPDQGPGQAYGNNRQDRRGKRCTLQPRNSPGARDLPSHKKQTCNPEEGQKSNHIGGGSEQHATSKRRVDTNPIQ
jgi:hypothetical protein